eukprot:TRINITY_DN9092_c0_g1_i3.p1 TRINITY_DN9092_c0_g1~~TRINITY_DN9092_c0_g1_i3.p1  ORF type:complete len:130 (+),score=25.88 TRINITY_DN9092_c0_g1_i3:294-683(+)
MAPAFSFKSRLTLSNAGSRSLGGWGIEIEYIHNEVITGVDGAVLPDSISSFPIAGDGLVFTNPTSLPFLETAFLSGGDALKFQYRVDINGTEVRASSPVEALPAGLTMAADGLSCNKNACIQVLSGTQG